MASRVAGALSKAAVPLATVGVGVAAMRAYREVKEKGGTLENAVRSGVAAAAVPAAIAASPVVAKVGEGLRYGGFATARAGMEMLGSAGGQIDNVFGLGLGMKMIVGGGAVGGLGAGLEVVGKVTSKVVLPAAAAFGAYQGVSEDSNKIRGAARGGLRSLDPTAIMMKRGVVERGFDAAFGKPSAPSTNRLTSSQEQKFASANMDYHQKSADHGTPKPQEGGKGWVNGRGFANPDVQEAAQEGRRKKMGVP